MSGNETLNLWQQLKKIGDFSKDYYDKCIIDDLKKVLSITGDFDSAIKKISPIYFLTSFFQAISPLTSMYTDILDFFDRCGANTSNKNIEIRIETEDLSCLNFNASHFLHARVIIKNIKRLSQTVDLTTDGIFLFWKLPRKWMSSSASVIENESFNRWYSIYNKQNEVFPTIELDFDEIIENTPIKGSLTKAFVFWKALYNYYKSVNIPRNNWWECTQKQAKNEIQLLQPETDYILGTALGSLYYIAENYTSFSADEQNKIKNILEAFSKYVNDIDDFIEVVMPELEKFLKLPVWEQRYALYSVWIFTRIIADFPNKYLSFNVKNNTLSFAFSGECLASIVLNGIQIDFWNELRTVAITKPVGKSRKNAIQPDYSIVSGCADDANSSIIVVECKQYEKPSYVNFSEAIIDYTNNRPKARVILTDYGRFNISTLSSKVLVSKERYMSLSMCRPASKSVKLLSKSIWDTVRKFSGALFNIEDTVSLILKWGEKPLDLDLHLFFKQRNSKETYRTYYSCENIPDTVYMDDIRSGYGPEQISINKLHEGNYEIWVNNYSGTPSFFQSNATLTAVFEKSEYTFTLECPKENDLQWWYLFSINTYDLQIEIVNKLMPQNFNERF